MNLDVKCVACGRELNAAVDNGVIVVSPCPSCQREKVVRVFREFERPDDPPRYSLKNTPDRGYYVGRHDRGPWVKVSEYRKLARHTAALRTDYESMMSSPCVRFRRCRLCGVMTSDGWICSHCGGDDTINEED